MHGLCSAHVSLQRYRALAQRTSKPLCTPDRAFSNLFSSLPFASAPVSKADEPKATPQKAASRTPPPSTEVPSFPPNTPRSSSRAPRYHREPRNKKQESSETYAFPIGRALQYIRVGQHVRRQELFFLEEFDNLLHASRECANVNKPAAGRLRRRRGAVSMDSEMEADGNDSDMHAVHSWLFRLETAAPSRPENDVAADTGGTKAEVKTLSEEEREKIERFLRYHMHHVVVSYKKKKEALHAPDSRTDGGTASPAAVRVVCEYILYASLLLHLSALFGFSGSSSQQHQMIEKLIQTAFSCSIFLSQYLRCSRMAARNASKPRGTASAHRRRHDEGREDGFGGFFQLLTPACTNSLHWGVVHFCEGVRVWELLSHQFALQPITLGRSVGTGGGSSGGGNASNDEGAAAAVAAATRAAPSVAISSKTGKTFAPPRDPYHVLLQTHARLVLALVPRTASEAAARHQTETNRPSRGAAAAFEMPATLQDALVLLGGNETSQGKSHAILKWMGEYTEEASDASAREVQREVRYRVGDAIETPQGMRVQNRRLQLLPLFWTALVSHGVVHALRSSSSPAPPSATHMSGGASAPVLDLRAARHALRAVIPLFQNSGTQAGEAASVEPSFFYILSALYACPFAASSYTAGSHRSGCTSEDSRSSSRGTGVASATELLALLAALEKHRVLTPQMWEEQHRLSERERRRRSALQARGQRPAASHTTSTLAGALPRTQTAFMCQHFMRFLADWFRQQARSAPAGESVDDLVALKRRTELYLSLSTLPFSLLFLAPSLAAVSRAEPVPMWRTLRRELPRLYTATLLRHLAQWQVTVGPTAETDRGGAGDFAKVTRPLYEQQQQQQQQQQREMVLFVEELEVTLRAVLRVVQFARYQEGEAAEKEGGGEARSCATFDGLLEKQLLRLMAFQLGCEVYPRRLQRVRDVAGTVSTREKELVLAIHRCLTSVFAVQPHGAESREAAFGQGCHLHPEYGRHLHLLLEA